MDLVVVTRAADAHLLRIFLASYECFWEGGGRLVVVTRRRDSYLWEDIRLPENTRLVYREDFPELGPDDFRNQLYLKLLAHQFVETEHFVIMDSDFLFIAPCSDDMFFYQGRPVWFHREWDPVSKRWRKASEHFVGETMPHNHMAEVPQYIFSRTIAAELCRRFDLRQILEMTDVSEFIVYGWFAWRYFHDAYHWVDIESPDITPIGQTVNQLPPSYCHLDPHVSVSDFSKSSFLAFWSHWDLAEAKMVEFLLAAQQNYPDRRLDLALLRRIYPLIPLPAPAERLYSEMRGLSSDGWVKDELWFSVNDLSPNPQLQIEFDVPADVVIGKCRVDGRPDRAFVLTAGPNCLVVDLCPGLLRHRILLQFDQTESAPVDAVGRSLRARLVALRDGITTEPAIRL